MTAVLEEGLWTDQTKINLYKMDGETKLWRKKGYTHETKHAIQLVKYGEGIVLCWACMAASETGNFTFIDDVTHDKSGRINSDVYRNILYVNLQRNSS